MILQAKMQYHLKMSILAHSLNDIPSLEKHSELYTKYLNQLHPTK